MRSDLYPSLALAVCILTVTPCAGSTFTPLEWTQAPSDLPPVPDGPFQAAVGFGSCIDTETRGLFQGRLVTESNLVSAAVLRFADAEDFRTTIEGWRSRGFAPNVFQFDDLQLGHGTSARGHEAIESTFYGSPKPHERGILGWDVGIAIVDAGVDAKHVQLNDTGYPSDRWIAGYDAIEDQQVDPAQSISHGSSVAGIALGKAWRYPFYECRTYDCVGMAPEAGLVDIKVTDSSLVRLPHVFDGLGWLAVYKYYGGPVHVANLSFFSCREYPPERDILAAIANLLVDFGISVVAAHGNASGCGFPSRCDGPCTTHTGSPGSAVRAITVAGTDDGGVVDRRWHRPFCDGLCGPEITLTYKPDLSASAELVRTPAPITGTCDHYARRSGTSIAAAHVSGAAALVKDARPYYSADDIKLELLLTADDQHHPGWWDRELGWGILALGDLRRPLTAQSEEIVDVTFVGCQPGATGESFGDCQLEDGPYWSNSEAIVVSRESGSTSVTVNVVNRGSTSAEVMVRLEGYRRTVGNRHFYTLGEQGTPRDLIDIPAGKTRGIEFVLTQENQQDLQNFRASIQVVEDRSYGDNRTQHNLEGESETVSFWVENPFFDEALLRFETNSSDCIVRDSRGQPVSNPREFGALSCPEAFTLESSDGTCQLRVFGASPNAAEFELGGVAVNPNGP